MSRSVFAERFSRIVGLPPMDYLLRWRMAVAKDALRSGRRRLAEVAFACGYQTVSAFSTAFTRTVGCAPSRYALSLDREREPEAHAPLRN
jgi:AraC-like DNA-binding protein